MKRVKHWQDPVNGLLGIWLILSPWVLGFQNVTVAMVSTMAIGALLIASSLEAMQVPQAWEEWMDVVLGAVLMLTPAVLGFDDVTPALLNALVTGGLVTALAIWVLLTDDEFAASWRRFEG
jgi:ABC-type molybdate transport system permease subunit